VKKLRQEIAKVIIGQDTIIRQLLASILVQGHVLIIGVPGLGKTLLVKTLAQVLNWNFKRIQFTPDMMPADIIGMELLQEDRATGARTMRFLLGPIFANIILADEINRTPPKTQAALLEAMQEHRVTVGEQTYTLPEPFFVLATQNPIEQEGTYPLPEAQLDRFIFNIKVDYPSWDEEIEIMKRVTGVVTYQLQRVLGREDIMALQQLVRRVPVADHIFHYAATLARSTRPGDPNAPQFIKDYLAYGGGPRASFNMVLTGKARAILRGRYHVAVEDIQAVALPVMRHRIIPNFAAQSEGLTADDIILKLLRETPTDERLYDGKIAAKA
jgi:MoxR-like ATPase